MSAKVATNRIRTYAHNNTSIFERRKALHHHFITNDIKKLSEVVMTWKTLQT